MVVFGWWLDLMSFIVFSNLWFYESMISFAHIFECSHITFTLWIHLKNFNNLCITTSQHSSCLLFWENKHLYRYFHGQTSLNNPFFLCNLFLTSYRWNKSWGERGESFLPSCFHTIVETGIKIKIKSPSVPSASSWWLSSAYFPLALFRLLLPVYDETEEKVTSFEKCELSTWQGSWSFHKGLVTAQSCLGKSAGAS